MKPKSYNTTAGYAGVLTIVMISVMVILNIAIFLPSSSNFLCQVLAGGFVKPTSECA
jgi:hypothetical protein